MKTFHKILTIILVTFLTNLVQSQPTFSDNCLNYNSNFSVCQQCNPGFYLQFFFCISCNPNCICSSQQDFCQSCQSLQYNGLNYYSYHDPQLDQCLLCNNSMPYCLECENLQLCTSCFNGQYLVEQKDLDGVVTRRYCSSNVCQVNCQFCLNQIDCKECQPGFFLYLNNSCSQNPCTANCTTCSSPTQCSVCASGYFSSNGQCVECVANCTQCTNATGCQVCAPSFTLANSTCNSTGLSNCVQYASGDSVCTGCQAGYEVTAGSCNQCTGCNLCNQQFICLTQCLPGYLQFNFACIPSFQPKIWFYAPLMIIFTLLIS